MALRYMFFPFIFLYVEKILSTPSYYKHQPQNIVTQRMYVPEYIEKMGLVNKNVLFKLKEIIYNLKIIYDSGINPEVYRKQ